MSTTLETLEHTCTVREVGIETHDVRHFTLTRPENYRFRPGQATEWSLFLDAVEGETRPFSFTSLPDAPELEFYIKTYVERDGVTEQMLKLQPGDEVRLGEPFGAIEYFGRGTFIAGGAGVTPFIGIIRKLHADGELEGNRLVVSHETSRDIILRTQLEEMLGEDLHVTLTREDHPDFDNRRIDEAFLEDEIDDLRQMFYVCGPPQMVEDVRESLLNLGADEDRIVTEDGF